MLGQQGGPATWPNASRLVEKIFIYFTEKHANPTKVHGKKTSRWNSILSDYAQLQNMVYDDYTLRQKTNLQLFDVNYKTLLQW